MKKQALAIGLGLLAALSLPAGAQLRAPADAAASPFYGGIALRQAGNSGSGIQLGELTFALGKFGSPMTDDATSRALLFGGYRLGHDLALEASVGTAERYALQPDSPSGRRGVGLSLVQPEAGARIWNADVYTTWSFLPRFAVYGRLGYAQTDSSAAPALATLPATDPRRRDGMNYGVGLRYDVNRALGLRLEYARFGRFAGELPQSGALPDTDQVQFGVQLRF